MEVFRKCRLLCGMQRVALKLLGLLCAALLLQACGSSKSGQQAEAPSDYPDYKIPEEATDVPDDVEPYTPKWYVERYKVYAIKEMKRTGIPASITLAQGMLESSYGKSRLAKEGNNHFGIKCHRGNWGGGKMYLADDRPNECFRTYESVLHSYHDHSEFLSNGTRYEDLFELKPNNYAEWAEGLKEAGYATNPRYDDILIKLIKEHNLHYFDQFYNKPYKGKQLVAKKDDKGTSGKAKTLKENGLKAFIPKTDQPLSQIAKKTGVSKAKLRQYNDFQDPYATVKKGLPLYLEPKKSKPAKSYHVVEKGESLWAIAQQYGVTVQRLYKRNRLTPPSQPPVGARLFLRKVRYKAMPERKSPLAKPEKKEQPVADKTTYSGDARPRYHAVQEGETMQEIAKQYDISIPKLYKLNRLKPGQQPAVGEEIHLKETRYIKPEIRETPSKPSKKLEQKGKEQSKAAKKADKDSGKASKQSDKNPADKSDQQDTQKSRKQTRANPVSSGPKNQAKRDQQQERQGKTAPEKPAENVRTHTVKAGQTLFGIARQYGVTVESLKKWNELKDATIAKGLELKVKPGADEPSQSRESEKPADKVASLPAYHTVKQGETLYGIAREYEISIDQLKQRNELKSANLQPGQKLRIKPKTGTEASAESDPDSQVNTHTVKKGETLFEIAQGYDVSVKELKQANDLGNNTIQEGQELNIP